MIDDIYRVVQIIANKNNYGVITPERFNKLCQSVQLRILSEIPDDYRRAKGRFNSLRTSSQGISDAIDQLQYILDVLTVKVIIKRKKDTSFPSGYTDHFVLPPDIHYINSIWFKGNIEVSMIDKRDSGYIKKNKLTSPTEEYPIYENIGDKILITPTNIGLDSSGATSDVIMIYQRIAKAPKWTFINVNNSPVFNPSDSTYQDFELPNILFDRIVIDLAELIGVHLREQEVEQFAQKQKQEKLQRDTFS